MLCFFIVTPLCANDLTQCAFVYLQFLWHLYARASYLVLLKANCTPEIDTLSFQMIVSQTMPREVKVGQIIYAGNKVQPRYASLLLLSKKKLIISSIAHILTLTLVCILRQVWFRLNHMAGIEWVITEVQPMLHCSTPNIFRMAQRLGLISETTMDFLNQVSSMEHLMHWSTTLAVKTEVP